MQIDSRIFGTGWVAAICFASLVACSKETTETQKEAANKSEKSTAMRDYEALVLCKYAIRLAAKDKDADIPYVRAVDTGAGFSFTWKYGVNEIKVTTPSGQNLRVDGFCGVDKSTKEIVSFALAGVKLR